MKSTPSIEASGNRQTGLLGRTARTCVRHRWIVVGIWLSLLVAVNAVSGAVGPDYRTDFSFPDSESKEVQETLEAAAPDRAGFTAQIVVQSEQGVDTPAIRSRFEELVAFVESQGDITVTSPYENPQQISDDGTIAFAQLDIRDSRTFPELQDVGTEIVEYGESLPSVDGLDVEYGGDLFAEFEMPESEIFGLIAAVIILIVAFGSVLAMGLPIGTALFGLGIASALVTLGSNIVAMPDFTTAMVAMIGIGVGIDYALFIVTRYRENLHAGASVSDSVVQAVETSGRAVLFAGVTVIISLMGLFLMGLSFVSGIAVAASIGVLMMIFGSLTLLPALLGLIGTRIERTTWAALGSVALLVLGVFVGVITGQNAVFFGGLLTAAGLFALSFAIKPLRRLVPHRAQRPRQEQLAYRWSRFIQHRPWPSALGAVAVLVVLAIPLTSIRLGFGDYGNFPEDTTVRRAYDLIADGFGPGSNGPLFLTVEGTAAADPNELDNFVNALEQTDNIAFTAATPITDQLALVTVYPDSAPQDAETSALVDDLRTDVIPASGVDAQVGGFTAAASDFSSFLGGRMPWLIGVVLLLSFVLLMAVFRSILVPLKAVVMNLLSIGAAYGVIVAIFQWGWASDLIGVAKPGPIDAWIPMFLFAIVFGLSMDYEVFLLSRIKEEYDRTKVNAVAVADGLAATARVITAAALIMFCVFSAFVLGDDRSLKLFGFGLAIAVLIDATIVRMLLVPATMELLDDRNWWIPRWLDRLLPDIDVEGHGEPELSAPPRPGEAERDEELTSV
ncbi:MMPL family transporter [Ilumatobacter sp.]|uniref:MMPL family transporter n=1 Tax=Ilumatobacter sp. TaxID=1967498 RepID=UPI003C51F74B